MSFRQIKSPALADKAVINTKLDESAVAGQGTLTGMTQPENCFTLLYDVGSDSLKKIATTDFFGSFSTDQLTEGDSKLYFTDQRAQDAVAQDIADAVTVETNRAVAAETLLQSAVDAEEAARIAKDNAQDTAITNEVSRATGEEGRIETEYKAADAALSLRIDNIISNVDEVALNSLAEIVTAFEDADDVLSASVISNSSAISTEVARATAAEQANATAIATETSRAQTAESQLSSAIATETAARIAGDNALGARVTVNEGDIADLETALAAEISATDAEISTLQSDLADEVTRATGAEAANAASIQDEITARAAADTAVRTDMLAAIASGDAATLTSSKSYTDGKVAELVSADSDHSAGIAANAAAISAEETRATAAEGVLTSDLATEVVRATAAEEANADDIAAEVVRATGEEARIEAKLDNVISNTDSAALDSLTEIVAEFQKVDGEISALVASNTTAITNEASARSSADSVLQTNINTEAATRAAADTSLQGQIDAIELDYIARDVVVASNAAADATQKADQAEADAIAHADAQDTALIGDASVDGTSGNTVSARILTAQQAANTYTDQEVASEAATRLAADNALSLRATNLEGRMDTAETDIDQNAADIVVEQNARVAADVVLDGKISTEASAREAADLVLQNAIDAEETARIGGDATNATAISNEVTRATGVEAGLRVDVDANTVSAANNATAISNEVVRAKAAEAANATAITDEVTRATAAESALSTSVANEVQARIDGDAALRSDVDLNTGDISALDSDLSAEIARATAAEGVNANAITAEVTRATGIEAGLRTDVDTVTGRVDAIIGTSPETLDTLQEIVAAFEDADSDIQAVISANSGRLTVNEGDIDAVEVRATDLESRATSLEGRATAVETKNSAQDGRLTVNEGDIDSLETKVGSATLATTATDLSAAINEIHTQVDLEAGKVSVLEGEMDAVEGRATTLESEMNAVEAEQALQAGRLTVNEGDIDALEAKVGSAEVALDTTAQTLVGGINEVHGEVDAAVARVTQNESDISDNASAISAEETRALGQEALIRSEFAAADSAMTAAYIAADAVVTSNAAADATSKANTAEANAKVYADGKVADEAVARENADIVLQTAITNEETARQTADAALSNRATALETEMTATQSGAGLGTDGSYTAPSGSTYLDLSTSLKDADAKLDAAIAAEKARAEGVESGLQSEIDAEELARAAGDSAINVSLAAEVARATGVEATQAGLIQDNADALVTEAATRAAADEALQDQIDFIKANTDSAALDSLTEIVAAFQSADGTLTGLVSQNQSDISDNATAIATEATSRATADAGLQTNIDNLESATNTALAGKVSKSGDSMTGELAMGGNKVSGVANGTVAADAVNKGQLDAGLAAQHISQFSTTDLAEGDNQYFTNVRAQDAISVVDVSGEGNVSKSGGVISIDTAKSLLELTDVVDSAITDKEGFVLRAKTDGTGFELVSPDLLSFSRSKRQVFNGDGAQTTFAIDFDVTEQNAMVFVGGVIQDPSVHYFIDTEARTITFNGAIPVGTQAVLVAQSSTSVGVLDPGSVTLETLAPNVKVFQQGNDVVVGTSATAVSSFPVDVYRSAKYVVSVELNGEFETRECLVVHNGTDAYITEYGIIYTGNDLLGDTDVRVVNGTVELTYTAVSAGAVVTASASYIDV